MLRPVSSASLSSSTTTIDPVSSLHPSVLFPFFHPAYLQRAEDGRLVNTAASPSTRSDYRASAESPCQCAHLQHAMPTPTFIKVPSQNPNQSITLPVPAIMDPSQAASGAPMSFSLPEGAAGLCPQHRGPMLIFSHGTTQVDTIVPVTHTVQRTRYSWSQLADYTVMKCSDLPDKSHSHVSQSGSAMRIENGFARICSLDEIAACPGHPWIIFSYTVNVRQWQEDEREMVQSIPPKHAAAMPDVEVVDSPFALIDDYQHGFVGSDTNSEFGADEVGSILTTDDDCDSSGSEADDDNAMSLE